MATPEKKVSAQQAHSLYYTPEKIYPREVKGFYQKIRTVIGSVTLAAYYLLPWLSWNDRQAILFDLPNRKFYLGPWVFWPHDFYYLTWLLICLAFALFLASALAGRVWCGYACPQTLWTNLFVAIERWVEGSAIAQKKLADSPPSFHKFRIRCTKQALWILLSLITGVTFVGYFVPVQDLITDLISFNIAAWPLFWIFFYSLATYGNAGFLREQVCQYMCPYARFQSVMLDKDSLVIAYNPNIGNPRGSIKKNQDRNDAGLGDCIDCKLCVQVCPTGIDIREGLQYECIACAACVDVCNSVMDKVQQPQGLISYTTLNRVEGKKTNILRPRILFYSLLVSALTLTFIWSLSTRKDYGVDVIRDRTTLSRYTDTGSITNLYTLKILNKSEDTKAFMIELPNQPGFSLSQTKTPSIEGGQIGTISLTIEADRDAIQDKSIIPVVIRLSLIGQSKNEWVEAETNFITQNIRGQL